ncbi:hypothetical protein [Streptomyces sp. NPDC059176]|uniref:hypothetical protein n=1 Tax=unclassified Streptomyces TaxID=2593676 RepID=UPI00367ABA60
MTLSNASHSPLHRSARDIKDMAAAHTKRTDDGRRSSPTVVAAPTDAGFAHHFVPRTAGGEERTSSALLGAVPTMSEGGSPPDWCTALLASHTTMAHYLPDPGQKEVWANAECGSQRPCVPSGTHRTTQGGGWRLTGGSGFPSGVDLAKWALLSTAEPDTDGRIRLFAVPREAPAVVDTWFTVGPRGTSSRTVVLKDVFVPQHDALTHQALLDESGCPGPADGRGTLPRRVAPPGERPEPAGTAQEATRRPPHRTPRTSRCAGTHRGRADSATPLTGDLVARRRTRDGRRRKPPARRGRAQGSDHHPLQRAWPPDVHAATSHAALQLQPNAAAYARHALSDG